MFEWKKAIQECKSSCVEAFGRKESNTRPPRTSTDGAERGGIPRFETV
jgi:hypothetical protein